MNNRKSKLLAAIVAAFSISCLSAPLVAAEWDEGPSVQRSISPENPNKLAGMVTAVLEIDESGAVIGATISKSTDSLLERPVLEAVKKWAFMPAKKDGVAISCTIKVPFSFKS